MKQKLFLSLLVMLTAITAHADVEINETNFPDENFRDWLIEQEYGKDGVLTPSEIAGVTDIEVVFRNIKSLKGIEHFTALTSLNCSDNQLTELDVSKNISLTKLYCWSIQLTSLDMSKNTSLTILNCSSNKLTKLDVSKNTELTSLDCSDNELTKLDVSNNTELTNLSCNHNRLTALDISKSTSLTTLNCEHNQLTELDVSENTALTKLTCYQNKLIALDVSNSTILIELSCASNKLTALDVSKNTVLTSLYCNQNQLTELDVSKNTALTSLFCFQNQLTELDVSKNSALTGLYCFQNKLTSLNVSKDNTALVNISCYNNQLSKEKMDALVENLPSVRKASLYIVYNKDEGNMLTTTQAETANSKGWRTYAFDGSNWQEYTGEPDDIEVIDINETNFPDENFRSFLIAQEYGADKILTNSDIAGITALNVNNLGISSLKGIEHFTALTSLNCSNNHLTSLDVSKCTFLNNIQCYNNQIHGEAMDNLVKSLPIIRYSLMIVIGGEDDKNVMTVEQVAAAKAKGWKIFSFENNQLELYIGSGPSAIDKTNFPDVGFRNWLLSQSFGRDGVLLDDEIAEIKTINVNNHGIKDLKGIERFTALTNLSCEHNQLTEMDLSKNTELTELDCYMNQLTSLDVSKNRALNVLTCGSNQLTSLDVSNNTTLINLSCDHNQLTSLDVSKNTALIFLDCSYNQLTELDMSKNTLLEVLNCIRNELTSLDISKNNALTRLSCMYNQLTNIDVSKNTALTYLTCGNNQLMELNVSNNMALTILECYDNLLNTLDVSKNTALTGLNCRSNKLTELDVSKNTELIDLVCAFNQLTTLDVSKNTELTALSCYGNQIKGEAMDALVGSLPTLVSTTDEDAGFLAVSYEDEESGVKEHNIMTTIQVEAAKAKGWNVWALNTGISYWWQKYAGSDPDVSTAVPLNIEHYETNTMYDLSGRQVAGNVSKGLFIVNGRKVLVK